MNAPKTDLFAVLVSISAATACFGQEGSSPLENPASPPAAPPQRSEADLEKLVAPIALYPDPLLATLLPASTYPVEIVQAARFVKDTNNVPNIDSQPWDQNVKALAQFPDVLQKMNDDLAWTSDLGQAFVEDQKGVMNAIQVMRGKAQQAGTLQTTPQQVVVVTNNVVEKTVEQQVVYVTNTIVQIEPAQPQVIYVPQYNPAVVYAPPSPGQVAAASIISFGVGMAVGAVIANNCNWHSGGVYVGGGGVWGGGYHGDVNVNRNVNVNQNFNRNNYSQNNLNRNNFSQNNLNRNNLGQNNLNRSPNLNQTASAQRWQPDSTRRTSSVASSTPQSRGWSGSSSVGSSRGLSPTGYSSPGFGGASSHSAFNSYGGGSQARMASARGASSWGGARGGGVHRR